MQWTSEGYILSTRRHGETSAIIDVITPDQGRHAGLVRGGVGRKLRPVLQPGNKVRVSWQARLSEHLGNFTVEPIAARAAELMEDRLSLSALNAACAVTLSVMPEREPHEGIYAAFDVLMGAMHDPDVWPALFVKWEAGLLNAMGYGLDLSRCAASGVNDNLTHVSPRSGRAVSASEAEPYLDKLLALPEFMMRPSPVLGGDIEKGLAITGHFIEARILWPVNRTMPEARAQMIERLKTAGRL